MTESGRDITHMTESGREMPFEDISPDIADFSAAHRLDKAGLRPGAARFKSFDFFALIIIEHTLREVSVAVLALNYNAGVGRRARASASHNHPGSTDCAVDVHR